MIPKRSKPALTLIDTLSSRLWHRTFRKCHNYWGEIHIIAFPAIFSIQFSVTKANTRHPAITLITVWRIITNSCLMPVTPHIFKALCTNDVKRVRRFLTI